MFFIFNSLSFFFFITKYWNRQNLLKMTMATLKNFKCRFKLRKPHLQKISSTSYPTPSRMSSAPKLHLWLAKAASSSCGSRISLVPMLHLWLAKAASSGILMCIIFSDGFFNFSSWLIGGKWNWNEGQKEIEFMNSLDFIFNPKIVALVDRNVI